MFSKILKKDLRLFFANRYIVIGLLVSSILILPIKGNAQWMPVPGAYGFVSNPIQGLLGYGTFSNPIQGLLGYNPFPNPMQYLGGYGFVSNPMQYQTGYGFGVNPMQGLWGYGLFGGTMQYMGGYGLGVTPVREPITEKGLISKVKDLGGGEALQISRSDELVEYYEIMVISKNMVPPPINDYPYHVDTNEVAGVVKGLLDNDNYSFVFVSKEGMSDKYLIVPNDTPYSPSVTFGGLPTYPVSAFYGGLFGGIPGYGGLQYPVQRINEANLLPNLSSLFNDPIYGNLAIPLILGNIPLYGRPTVIPSETFDNDLDLRVDPHRSSHFNPINTGLSYSMNLMTMPFQPFIPLSF